MQKMRKNTIFLENNLKLFLEREVNGRLSDFPLSLESNS